VVSYKLVFTRQALKDTMKISGAGLRANVETLLKIIKENSFQKTPPLSKLIGDLKGAYSRRINIQHRLLYQVYEKEKVVKIIRMWTHYE
jgi:toxin YoeB